MNTGSFIATSIITRNFHIRENGTSDLYRPANIEAMKVTFERFRWLDINQFRSDLAKIAKYFNYFPADDGKSEWVCLRDDDDIHIRIPSYVFNVPNDVVMVAWSTDCVSFIPQVSSYVHRVNYRTGAGTGSYALRRSWFNSLTESQRILVTFDHGNVHRYVHWSGYRYFMFSEVIGTVYLIHPISISAGTLNISGIDYEHIKKVQSSTTIPYIREVANLYLSLADIEKKSKISSETHNEDIQK